MTPRLRKRFFIPLLCFLLPSGTAIGNCIDYGQYLHLVGTMPATYPPGFCVAASESIVYLGGYDLYTIDVSNPTTPVLVGQTDVDPFHDVSHVLGLSLSGSLLAVIEQYPGTVPGDHSSTIPVLKVFDVSDPKSPLKIGDGPGGLNVTLSGSKAYVASGQEGLKVVDLSNPAAPLLATADTPGQVNDVALSGNLAYVADGSSGLRIVDVTYSYAPKLLGHVATSASAMGVVVSGTVAYVIEDSAIFEVVDVTDPALPAVVGHLLGPGTLGDVIAASETRVLVTSYYDSGGGWCHGVLVIDVSNPALPTIIGIQDTPGDASQIALAGGKAFIADGWYVWLSIFEICAAPTAVDLSSFKAVPQPNGILLNWSVTDDLDVSGFHIDRSEGIEGEYQRLTSELIRVGSPYRYLDSLVMPDVTYRYRLAALNRMGNQEFFGPIVARSLSAGTSVSGPVLGVAYPNPGRGVSTIPFVLSRSEKVRLRVLDLNGREVRVLEDMQTTAGAHTAEWDGKDKQGSLVPSGIYFYQLQSPEFNAARKLVRLANP